MPVQPVSECESNPHPILIRMAIRLTIREPHKRVESGYCERSLSVYGRYAEPDALPSMSEPTYDAEARERPRHCRAGELLSAGLGARTR